MPQPGLRARIGAVRPDEIAGWALRLVGAPSPNPPLDTRAAAEEAAATIRAEIPEAELSLHQRAVYGKLFARGAADMKDGIAASIAALARQRGAWSGEAVLTLAGDEESMGPLGTSWLLDHVPHARGTL